MKNTVKKILALVFVVAMVCSLAVPAFAANGDDKVDVKVTVVLPDGSVAVDHVSVALEAKKANVESALKATDALKAALTVNSAGKVTYIKVAEGGALTKVTDKAIVGEFGTGSVVVAVNGKAVSEDLGTVAVEEDDIITVYWADSTLGTKLAMVDDSAIAQGIVSLYYYDAEGNRQPLKGAELTLSYNGGYVVRDYTNKKYSETGDKAKYNYEYYFTTDEKGQIWISPEYLDEHEADMTYTITYKWVNKAPAAGTSNIDKTATDLISRLDAVTTDDGYSQKEVDYYNDNDDRNIVDVEVIGHKVVVEKDLYDVAGATGDMTVVYALVAFAAVATIAAVVVMKKKSVKAN